MGLPTAGAPTADPQTVSVPFQTATAIILTGTDHNTPPLPLTYIVLTQPTHGVLTGTAPNLTYKPADGYAGADSFTFRVNNGFENSLSATIAITVGLPTAGAPTADPQTVSVPFQTSKAITLTGADHNTPPLPLTYSVLTQPTHGVLTGTAPNLTYKPADGYAGPDSFSFRVNNGFENSPSAVISILVGRPTAPAPVADGQSHTIPFQTQLPLILTGTDFNVPPLPLTYTVVDLPAHGTLSTLNGNQLTYTPAPLFSGADQFTFRVSNGFENSLPATVSITVQPTTLAPTAEDLNLTTRFRQPVDVFLRASDPYNLPLTYSLLSQPAHGSLTGTAPNLVYTPELSFTGMDTFTFKVNNGKLDSRIATVTISVGSVEIDHIIVEPDNRTIYLDQTQDFTATAYDSQDRVIPGVHFVWGVSSPDGAISASGVYRTVANFVGTRQYTVVAAALGTQGQARLNVRAQLSTSPNDNCGVIAYPVPYKVSSGLPGITFKNVAPATKIDIYTADARHVRTLESLTGENVVWDLKNSDGENVASWVYYYRVTQDGGACSDKKGKLVVIK